MNQSELITQCKQLAGDLSLEPAEKGWASGDVSSRIAIIGSYIGPKEVNAGIPFSGGAGRILWEALRKLDIKRTHVWCTNVIKRQAATKKDKKGTVKLDMSTGEVAQWENLLRWELQQLENLRIILVLGNEALHAITGEEGITNWRGSVLKRTIKLGRECMCLCTFNPASTIYNSRDRVTFEMDIGRFGRVVSGTYREHKITAHYNLDYDDAEEVIYNLHEDCKVYGTPLSVDIETPGRQLGCIGLATNAHEGYCINFRTEDDHMFTVQEELDIRRELNRLLSDPKVFTIMQNASFDIGWLWYHDRIKTHCNFDTLLAHHTLYPTLPHNLGYLTSVYTEHPFYKDEGKQWREGGDIDSHWEYNVKDVCITWAAYQGLNKELKDQSLYDFFMNHVMRLQPYLIEMQVLGILVDIDKRMEFYDTVKAELEDKLEQFQVLAAAYTGEDPDYYIPNPNSPNQMSDLLFNRLRIQAPTSSWDKENRTYMLNSPTVSEEYKEMIRLAGDYVTDRKFFGTYVETNIDEDDRMRCDYKQFGVQSAPGRLSSSATLWGSGGNLQNQPSRAYPMFIADPGYCFVYFDLSQAEARYVGWDAGIEKWIEDFERARLNPDEKFDCHRSLAASMFDTEYDDVPTYDRDEQGQPTIRFIGKRCRHGLNYMMGPNVLAQSTGLPMRDAIDAYNKYHKATPELRDNKTGWWATSWRTLKKNRELFNAYGRRLRILGNLRDEFMPTAIAFKPQSSIGDKVARCIYLCHEDPDWPTGDARVILNVHDALISLCKHAVKDTVAEIMRKHAEEPLLVNGRELIIPADVKFSQPDELGIHRWSTIQ